VPLRRSVLVLAEISQLALLCGSATAGASCPQVGFTFVEPQPSAETRAVKVGGNKTIYVRQVPLTTTSDIVAIILVDDGALDASLRITFTPEADRRLHEATTNHSGSRIAFMAGDDVLLNVVWEGPYGMDTGGTKVSMHHGMKRAKKLMQALQGCIGAPNAK